MNTVYLIRHGITEGNKKRLYYGKTNLPLIEEGIEEIKTRKNAGIYPNIDGFEVITTDLIRTEQTLFEIYGDVSHIKDNRLSELDFGVFEMLSYNELKDNRDYQAWIDKDNWYNVCPNGESGEIMLKRSLEAMNDYIDKNCFIVCHGGVISSLMMYWFSMDKISKNYYEWQPKPSEGYKIYFNNGIPTKYENIKL